MKTGGANTKASGGGGEQVKTAPETILFDPDHWVTSAWRSLKGYVLASIDEDIYQIHFGFPEASDLGEWLPLEKTLIHFEIDDITHPPIGFGDQIIDQEYDDTDETLVEHEAQIHIINFDVGVWASAKSGGVTARLEAYQLLTDLFNGPTAFQNLHDIGIELRSFTGGSFIKEEIDNISVFRVVNMVLVIRVVSRRIVGPTPYITQIEVQPAVTLSGDDIVITDEAS
jgi:hypothetical protein